MKKQGIKVSVKVMDNVQMDKPKVRTEKAPETRLIVNGAVVEKASEGNVNVGIEKED